MASKQIKLELAAFLDSSHGNNLEGVDRAQAKKVLEAFLTICYEQLGKKPQFLDGQDIHEVVGHLMPGHFGTKDPTADGVPVVLPAYFDHLEEQHTVAQAFEIRQSLQATMGEFLEAVRTGVVAHHGAPPQKPFVHGAAKLGRNDPCSCGSGKKFKKCHGKGL